MKKLIGLVEVWWSRVDHGRGSGEFCDGAGAVDRGRVKAANGAFIHGTFSTGYSRDGEGVVAQNRSRTHRPGQ